MSTELTINHPIGDLKSFSLDLRKEGSFLFTRLNLMNVSPNYSLLFRSRQNNKYIAKRKFLNILKYFIENKVNVLIYNEDEEREISLKDYTKKIYFCSVDQNEDEFYDLIGDYYISFPIEDNEEFIESIKESIIRDTNIEEDLLSINLRNNHGQICIYDFALPISFTEDARNTRKIVKNYLENKNERLKKDIQDFVPNANCEFKLEDNDDGFLYFKLDIFYEGERRRRKPILFTDEMRDNIENFLNLKVIDELKFIRQKNISFRYEYEFCDLVLDNISFMTHYNKNEDIFDIEKKDL